MTTWIGTTTPITTSAWNTASNWSAGVPTSSERIVFNTTVEIYSNVPITSANSVDVDDYGSLTIIPDPNSTSADTFRASTVRMGDSAILLNQTNVIFGDLNYGLTVSGVGGAEVTNSGFMSLKNLNVGNGAIASNFTNDGNLVIEKNLVVEEGYFTTLSGSTATMEGILIRNGGKMSNYGMVSSISSGSSGKLAVENGGVLHNYSTGELTVEIGVGNIYPIDISGTFINDGMVHVGIPVVSGSYNPGAKGIHIANAGNFNNTGTITFNIDPNNCIIVDNSGNSGSYSNSGNYVVYSGDPCGLPLPVTWLSFNGKQTDNSIELTWETASEINNEMFQILRSTDRENWEIIGSEPSKNGNSSSKQTYSFLDNDVVMGEIYFYQLKQIDYNSDFSLSETIFVTLDLNRKNRQISVYPNPLNQPTLYLKSNSIGIYELMNSLGQTIMTGNINIGQNKIDFKELSETHGAHFYYLIVKNSSGEILSTTKVLLSN